MFRRVLNTFNDGKVVDIDRGVRESQRKRLGEIVRDREK